MASPPLNLQIVINAGSSESGLVTIPGRVLGFGIPSNWTPAQMTFQTSISGGPPVELMREGNNYVLFVSPSSYSGENANYWGGVTGLMIRSGTVNMPVPQGSNVIVTVSYEPYG